jgi:type IV pilus assembly protein PilB
VSVLSANTQKQVEDILVEQKLLTAAELEKLRAEATKAHTPLLGMLVEEKHISNEDLTKAIAHVTKVPYVNLTNASVDPEVLALIPQETAERYMAVPLGEIQHRIAVGMLDADNVQAADFLANKIGRPIKVYAASEEGIRNVLAQYKAKIGEEVTSALADQKEIQDVVIDPNAGKEDIETVVQDSPVSKVLTAMLEYAATHRASDIHIEPHEKELHIRCRIDGVLREMMKLPKATEPPIVSRIKILANLKIDEHRIPQDGQFSVMVNKKPIDLRIAISPVVWGEQVVIRLLDKSGTSLKLEDLGYVGPTLNKIRDGLKRPNGMILTSGPTGSGKTTSMYALINEILNDEINIVTLEDPIEYKISGVNQIQVNADVGLTFATGLRSILRQDPDVIMVGEIRDKETATLAVQAALTGHLVFSTLHTNSASGILPRLLDMGIEPFLIASTVHTVIGQRLVRRLSDDKEKYQASNAEIEAVHATLGKILPASTADAEKLSKQLGYESLPLRGDNAYTLFKGNDSPDSPGGYKGRIGLYEVFAVTDLIQDLILKRSTTDQIQKAAQSEGMITMREDGYLKALAGRTSLTEVNRVAALDT